MTRTLINVKGQVYDYADLSPEQVESWQAEALAAFPATGDYPVVVIDPPWRLDSSFRNRRQMQGTAPYPTMTMAELKALPVQRALAPTAVVFLWATWPMLAEALELLQAWGLRYRTCWAVYCKRTAAGLPVYGTGYYTAPSTEPLLVATRGSGWTKLRSGPRLRQEFHVRRPARHSEKPQEFMEAIKHWLDVPKRLELFARRRHPTGGYDHHGLEMHDAATGESYFVRDNPTPSESASGPSGPDTERAR